eukprot:gene17843-24229_t
MYRTLLDQGVQLTAKDFAMGFRIEHPQDFINASQYGPKDADHVLRGKGPIPVADYKFATEVNEPGYKEPRWSNTGESQKRDGKRTEALNKTEGDGGGGSAPGEGPIHVADYKFATEVNEPGYKEPRWSNKGELQKRDRKKPEVLKKTDGDGENTVPHGGSIGQDKKAPMLDDYGGGGGRRKVPFGKRGVYSFCMCPGGQIVPTSTNPDELCINGMSFSRRNSQWANSALVVTMKPSDWAPYEKKHGPLAGVALQRSMEQAGSIMGGGDFVAPVQRVTDFMDDKRAVTRGRNNTAEERSSSGSIDPSGFHGPSGVLHGWRPRTMPTVRIDRGGFTERRHDGSVSVWEGAGYAGGIVSAAVDGLRVGDAIVLELSGKEAVLLE